MLDLNQNKVNKIRETTGVALIIARGSLKKFSNPLFIHEIIPIEREITRERKKAKRLRRIVAKRCFLNADSVNNKKKRLKTEKGSGKTNSESM